MKVMPRIEAAQHLGGGHRESVRDALVVGFLHSRRCDAEAEEAGVEAGQACLHRRSNSADPRCTISRSLGSRMPVAGAPQRDDQLDLGSRRHSSSTPWPTIPVAPKIRTFISSPSSNLHSNVRPFQQFLQAHRFTVSLASGDISKVSTNQSNSAFWSPLLNANLAIQ